ncbi:YceD family protein [Neolewinella antarctica]|uniref:Uncharacterized metal-binding protein YceD (DUF177 family) n=1 Tax=Neolewinella antarctica TaxID=442734 RepID=A0ABX0X6X0_9BACT|nr:DUF177 domain-containing protein [Neolewinella antarctica]NJC24618.1 uncharacterized metal-binding protein YceD (DUF177 family) [Neolewinella antarctica]
MSVQSPFIFPLRGLGQGLYNYELTIDDAFFASFADSPVSRADIKLALTVDRRTREMSLEFDFAGTIATTCDRCMTDIDLPIAERKTLIVQFTANADELEDEADLIYLDADTSLFNVAPYAYELVLLAIPMIRTFDCRKGESPYPCDEEMLNRIDGSIEYETDADLPDPSTTEKPGDEKPSPWDVLKDLQ